VNASAPIRRHARLAPGSGAFVRPDGRGITYAVLDRTIDALARRIVALGLVPGQVVALGARDSGMYLVFALALARLGIAFSQAAHPEQRADAALLERDMLDAGYPRPVALDELWTEDLLTRGPIAPVEPHPDGSAALMHCRTSGTTGAARVTSISHDLAFRRLALRAFTLASIAGPRGGPATRQGCVLPPSSWFGFSTVLRVLWSGGVVLQPPPDIAMAASWIEKSGVTCLVASPIALQKIVERMRDARAPNMLDMVEVAGGNLPLQVFEVAQRRLCANIVTAYGSTESGAAASAPVAQIAAHPGAVGYPYLGVSVEIVDEHDRPVATGQEGIVRIRSDYSADGYVGNPEASARVFRNGFVYPGDLGVLEADGLLRIVGRTDDVINLGGVKINPLTVEDTMRALADLRDVAVFALRKDGQVTAVGAAIVPTAPLDPQGFQALCRKHLGPWTPNFILHLDELPRNENGKVQRDELVRIAIEASRADKTLH
jgi:long-chain acyl-CoA synthetase